MNKNLITNSENMKTAKANAFGKLLIYITFILIFPIFFYILTKNSLIRQKQRIEETSSDIDVQLKKRFDLLVKQINAVKGNMKFEKETLTDIVKLREELSTGKKLENLDSINSRIDSIKDNINVKFEQYPDLKSSQNVVNLQDSIQSCENNIAASRRFFNTAVRSYNSKILTYPTNVAASAMKLSTFNYFKASAEEIKDVKIDLDFDDN